MVTFEAKFLYSVEEGFARSDVNVWLRLNLRPMDSTAGVGASVDAMVVVSVDGVVVEAYVALEGGVEDILTRREVMLNAGEVRFTGAEVIVIGGKVMLTDGEVKVTGGEVVLTDGEVKVSGGEVMFTDDEVMLTDGEVIVT